MKRFVAICATLLFVTIVGAISVGWMLGHPVQVRIGDPAADLNAEPVSFESDSGANFSDKCDTAVESAHLEE